MKQTSSDFNTNENESKIVGAQISNFTKGLGAYFAGLITNISLVIVFAIFADGKAHEIAGLLFYLAVSFLLLVLYSAATTRTVSTSISYKLRQIIKRLIDVISAALGIFFLTPLFILLSLAIRIESPGPILYRSKRIGQFRTPFEMYKFRTMYLAATERPITKVGNFLRQTRLNELPQLWNVLVGEMSLVGPSPRQPDDLDETLDSEGKILEVRPGITGLSEISRELDKDQIALDLQYIQDWSLILDMKILFKVSWAVFKSDSA
jgi:lipopolysaccharide/colanic/teichoic acid biosynthesis glycosyltransferase